MEDQNNNKNNGQSDLILEEEAVDRTPLKNGDAGNSSPPDVTTRYSVWFAIGLGLLFIVSAYSLSRGLKNTGPSYKDNEFVFHLVAHSHDDLGWLVSEEEYSDLIVSHILRSSTEYINGHPGTKFSFCNIGFLKHWIDTNPRNADLFKQAVKDGRMEVLNGGYSVHDNASPYFDDIINTYEYGREYVYNQFNYVPRTGWLVDPFGLSLTTTRLYGEMGYDQYVLNRVSDDERQDMRDKGQLQKNWRLNNGDGNYNLFFSEMADFYFTNSPMNFDFGLDKFGDKNPNMNILSQLFNFDDNIKKYANNLQGYISWFPTKNMLIPWGGDFYYRGFPRSIFYLDAVVIFMRCNSVTGRYNNYTFKASFVEEFFEGVSKEKSLDEFANKTGDYFPYIDNSIKDKYHNSWTGYFTTNPFAKRAIRSFSEAARGVKSLFALWLLRGEVDDISSGEILSQSDHLMWQVGINMHHDTITGTSKYKVADTYLYNTDRSFSKLNNSFNLFVAKYLDREDIYEFPQNYTLVSPNKEGLLIEKQYLHLYISQGGTKDKISRIRSNDTMKSILVVSQDTKIAPRTLSTCNFKGVCEHVIFDSFKTGQGKYYTFSAVPAQFIEKKLETGKVYNEKIADNTVTFSVVDGKFSFSDGKRTVSFGLFQYLWVEGSSVSANHNGKYIFASPLPAEMIQPDLDKMKYVTHLSKDGLDIHISYDNGLWEANFKYLANAPETHKYSVRLDCGVFGPQLPSTANYVIRYFSDVKNDGIVFTTDSNGLEKVERVFGEVSEVTDANYYPLTRFIYIQDSKLRQTVMLDRAEGGTSPEVGVIEVMVNRRTNLDDGKGATEGVDEGREVSILHYVVFDDVTKDQQVFRQHQVESDYPMLVYSVQSQGPIILSKYGRSGVDGIDNPLLRVMFDVRSNRRMMMRLYNMDEYFNYECDLLDVILNKYGIKSKSVVETGIDFNFKLEDMNAWKYKWNQRKFEVWKSGTLVLKPLQIRTFEITI